MAEEEQQGELTPEELLEHIRRMKVSDLLLSTISTVAQLGYAKLDPAGRDLEQAKLAIESLTRPRPGARRLGPGGGLARLQPGDGEPPARVREGADEWQESAGGARRRRYECAQMTAAAGTPATSSSPSTIQPAV